MSQDEDVRGQHNECLIWAPNLRSSRLLLTFAIPTVPRLNMGSGGSGTDDYNDDYDAHPRYDNPDGYHYDSGEEQRMALDQQPAIGSQGLIVARSPGSAFASAMLSVARPPVTVAQLTASAVARPTVSTSALALPAASTSTAARLKKRSRPGTGSMVVEGGQGAVASGAPETETTSKTVTVIEESVEGNFKIVTTKITTTIVTKVAID